MRHICEHDPCPDCERLEFLCVAVRNFTIRDEIRIWTTAHVVDRLHAAWLWARVNL